MNRFEGSEPETAPTGIHTRAGFLRKAGLGSAALVGGGALLGAPTAAFAGHSDDVSDADVLNYALTLEYLEATFYTQALGGRGTDGVPASRARFSRGNITGGRQFAGFGGRIRSEAYGLLSDIRDHEVVHVEFLRSQLGGAAVGPCTFDFSSALSDVRSFLATAQVLENTGVMAYDGAIRYVDAGDVLQAGAQIATVEARHASYLNLINRDSPFPSAFDEGKAPSEILAAASQFVVSCPPEVTALFGRLP
ncbi:MAG TPA: ferritin-like domain-containing protein [Solirubrobacteraceae bacterium]|nr:ferritin-like domain-containing protein [Solirubrobacteraceae bacterium]